MPAKKTVCIVGSHPRTRGDTPWSRKFKDIWVFNEAASLAWPKRVTAVFQMHKPFIWLSEANRNDPNPIDGEKYDEAIKRGAKPHREWMVEEHPDIEIYMQEKYDNVPASVVYPIDELCAALLPNLYRLGSKRRKSLVKPFTNSVAYAIALAIFLEYEVIEIYGVEMESNTEWIYQRENVAFWTGLAVGRGIEVQFRSKSGFFREMLYGYEGGIVIERQEFEAGMKHWRGEKILTQEAMQRAAIKVEKTLGELFENQDNSKSEELAVAYMQALKNHNEAILHFGMASGGLEENGRYMTIIDKRITALGGEDAADLASDLLKNENGNSEALTGRIEAAVAEVEKQLGGSK